MIMDNRIWGLAGALIVLAATASTASAVPVGGPCKERGGPGELQSKILFSSTRDHAGVGDPLGANPQLAADIYSINPDGSDPTRLTDNQSGDGFANPSPDGTKIVFDSDRLTADPATKTFNIDDLFVMRPDGTDQTLLTRGSSASWSPDCRRIAFHASAAYYASGGVVTGNPIKPDPGAATSDSDIFVANVDHLLAGRGHPKNITNTPDLIEDDADWSVPTRRAPHGRIVFTAHATSDSPAQSNQAELYVVDPNGSHRVQLTHNDYEERAPSWSPDGTRTLYSCRIGGGTNVFQICVINADGTGFEQLSNDTVNNLTASWSPDGRQIVYHKILRAVTPGIQNIQLFTMSPSLNPDGTMPTPREITCGLQQVQPLCPPTINPTPGINLLPHWGVLRVQG
jgi:TolB protein